MSNQGNTDAEKEVSSWGFQKVFTFVDKPAAYYKPHRHDGLTTHLILSGELHVQFPEDEEPKKQTFGAGARVDVAPNRLHEVWVGKDGCTMVIGEEYDN
ncbi:hypothetical protein EXIGLDRAFT_779563 [Exidia glandulosa HHB12029]|uniref:Cupin 2 conserved barrel domain-containing protein n=1 Tax=Exidia glandulosa HHB12029 TaxID=1314781 RepID=A0A165C065_EXIGL|nr:hypothetical protein EXIGLDRAFT_779563 [Exidia glandulosa HHB12029]